MHNFMNFSLPEHKARVKQLPVTTSAKEATSYEDDPYLHNKSRNKFWTRQAPACGTQIEIVLLMLRKRFILMDLQTVRISYYILNVIPCAIC